MAEVLAGTFYPRALVLLVRQRRQRVRPSRSLAAGCMGRGAGRGHGPHWASRVAGHAAAAVEGALAGARGGLEADLHGTAPRPELWRRLATQGHEPSAGPMLRQSRPVPTVIDLDVQFRCRW